MMIPKKRVPLDAKEVILRRRPAGPGTGGKIYRDRV